MISPTQNSNLELIDILTPKFIEQKNLKKLSLSQRHCKMKTKQLNMEQAGSTSNTNDETYATVNAKQESSIPTSSTNEMGIKIRSLSELISPNKLEAIITGNNQNNDQQELQLEIIISDADDENPQAKIRKKTKNKKLKKQNISLKLNNNEITPTKSTNLKKITIQRRLTKSTNLKTFSAKYLPANQQKIDSFFKQVPKSDDNGVRYYDTFEKTSPETTGITETKVTNWKEVAELEINRLMNNVNSKETQICEEINLISDDEIKDNVNNQEICKSNEKSNISNKSESNKSISTQKEPENPPKRRSKRLAKMRSSTTTLTSVAVSSEKNNNGEKSNKIIDKNKAKVRKFLNFQSNLPTSSSNVTSRKQESLSTKVSTDDSKKYSMTDSETIDLTEIDDNDGDFVGDKTNTKASLTTTKKNINKNSKRKTTTSKSSIKCPDYKIIKGTTFAVDAFRFGYIENVTHYFLTHFHADHYIGLKKSFSMPVYLSEITARLVSTIIGTSEQFLNVIHINKPITINGIEVTAIDANHCPGALMFMFKLPDGKCILHTGDFRAYPQMESEPIFWDNTIHTIYLDTTYLSSKYAFKTQEESIDDVINCIKEFRENHIGEKILIVCGAYVIGKEKVWMSIAEEFHLTVWVDANRRKTLTTINNPDMLKHLNSDPLTADIHILPMQKMSYDYLYQYLQQYSDTFDMVLAIRPSGWEKNSKPQYRGKVNIIGIEYSEHSSFSELRRFVRFLQPIDIISTVPQGYDLSKTTKIPKNWFNNDLQNKQIGFQSSITKYVKRYMKNSITSSTPKRRKKQQNNSININDNNDLDETDGVALDATKTDIFTSPKSVGILTMINNSSIEVENERMDDNT